MIIVRFKKKLSRERDQRSAVLHAHSRCVASCTGNEAEEALMVGGIGSRIGEGECWENSNIMRAHFDKMIKIFFKTRFECLSWIYLYCIDIFEAAFWTDYSKVDLFYIHGRRVSRALYSYERSPF